ncbi:MAG: hypothetical protein Q9208_007263 [Pyrenodesmia sp. 3 TL-2023]
MSENGCAGLPADIMTEAKSAPPSLGELLDSSDACIQKDSSSTTGKGPLQSFLDLACLQHHRGSGRLEYRTECPLHQRPLRPCPKNEDDYARVATTPTARTVSKFAQITKYLKEITRHGDETKGIRVENLIGFAHVPLGLAGPLDIHGHYQKGSIVAPMATVEATVVAGTARGCKAFQASGGVKAFAMDEGMGRAPVFFFPSVDDAVAFYKRVPSLRAQLQKDAEATSRYARLIRLTPHLMGTTVHVHFEYETGAAAGQNMTEIATTTATRKLLQSDLGKELKIIRVNPEGNMTADKCGVAAKAVRHPRGVQVMVWGKVSRQACEQNLRCHPAVLAEAFREAHKGDIRNSMEGSSVNVANAMAAIFIATGQDVACLVESCWAHLIVDYDESISPGISFSMFFPSVVVGSVGGGTVYPTQKEGLNMIGCAGPGRKWALAETIAAFVMVADVSTGAAVASNTKTSGHLKMARL